jgi:hypothetical protein
MGVWIVGRRAMRLWAATSWAVTVALVGLFEGWKAARSGHLSGRDKIDAICGSDPFFPSEGSSSGLQAEQKSRPM